MAKLRAFSVPPEHADAALTRTHAAGDAALFLDPALAPSVRDELCATFGPSSCTRIDADGSWQTIDFADGVTIDGTTALVVLTSGSTGAPKGVELSHEALNTAVAESLKRLQLTGANTVVQALPTHHVAGLLGVLRARALGATLHTVTATAALTDVQSDLIALVPTQLARLLASDSDLSNLGTVLLGGAAADPQLVADARARGAHIVTSYGMSETCGGCVYDGLALDGTTVLLDGPENREGRVLIRSRQLFRGYRTGRTRKDHDPATFFATNDHGVFANGVLQVTGRIDKTVISGGESIPLAAVRAALAATPDVTDVFVGSRPSHTWGTEVVAVVVTTTTIDTVKTHLRSVLPPHWVPRQIKTVPALPTTSLGKPDHQALLALFG